MQHCKSILTTFLFLTLAACSQKKVDETQTTNDAERRAIDAELIAMDAKAVRPLFAALIVAYPVLDIRDPRFDRRAYEAVLSTARDTKDSGLPGTQALVFSVLNTLNDIDHRSAYESFWSKTTSKSKLEDRDGTFIEVVTLSLDRRIDDGLDLVILNQQLDELGFRETCGKPEHERPSLPRIYRVLGANDEVLAEVPANKMICEKFAVHFGARCFGDATTPAMRPACVDSFFGRVPSWSAPPED